MDKYQGLLGRKDGTFAADPRPVVLWADYEQQRRATLVILRAVNRAAERLLALTKGSGSATYSAWNELDSAIAKMQEAFGIEGIFEGDHEPHG